MRATFLIPFFYLISLTTSEYHLPKVHESISEPYQTSSENSDPSKRTPRQSLKTGYPTNMQPFAFDFRKAQAQQDMLKFKYFQQQKSDFESYKRRVPNSKIAKALGDFLDEKRDEFTMNIPFVEDDWIPITSSKNIPDKSNKELQDISDKRGSKSKDLESADSEIVVTKIKPATDRKDATGKYIYIQPSILKNSFGLDSKTAQEILKKSSPSRDTGRQLNSLENLLNKNPEAQLEGLHKLLQQSGVFPAHQTSNLDYMQETLEGAPHQETDAFTVAQKQAEAHLQAQHKAIAQAQKILEKEALAKIAAHNIGQINIDPNEVDKLQQEAIAHLRLLEPVSSQGPQYAALVSDPTQAYGGHLKQENPIQQHQIPIKHEEFSSSTPKIPLENNKEFEFQVESSPSPQNVEDEHQKVIIAATRRPLVRQQVHHSRIPYTLLSKNQDQQHQIPVALTPRTILHHQEFSSSTPQPLLKQEQQHRLYFASTPRTIYQNQEFPSSTPHSFLGHQEQNSGHHQQVFASTPKTIIQHNGFPSSAPQTFLTQNQEQNHRIFFASTSRTIPQPQFYASSAPKTVLREQQPMQQVYLQHVSPKSVEFKDIPPITAKQKLVLQAPRSQVFLPQVQINSENILSQTPRPQVLIQHPHHKEVHQVSQKFVLQTPGPDILTPQHQPLFLYHETQPERVILSHRDVLSTPESHKVVEYNAQVNHVKNANVRGYPNSHGAHPTQVFVQGKQVSTVDYAPSYRAPAPEHSISYVNVAQDPQKSQHVQFVATPTPNNNKYHRVPSIEEQKHHQHLTLEEQDYGAHQNQLNYDDLHQYAANYAFGYKISDHQHGNDYGHEEKKDGKNTKGHYHVNLPDGRRQKVEYYVDDDGYHANVSYENIATHEMDFPHKK